MEVSGGEEDEGPIRIVKNYVRQVRRGLTLGGGGCAVPRL